MDEVNQSEESLAIKCVRARDILPIVNLLNKAFEDYEIEPLGIGEGGFVFLNPNSKIQEKTVFMKFKKWPSIETDDWKESFRDATILHNKDKPIKMDFCSSNPDYRWTDVEIGVFLNCISSCFFRNDLAHFTPMMRKKMSVENFDKK